MKICSQFLQIVKFLKNFFIRSIGLFNSKIAMVDLYLKPNPTIALHNTHYFQNIEISYATITVNYYKRSMFSV